MKQLKDFLESGIKLSDIKVKLPKDIREFANQFSEDILEEVWLVGPMMGDWFVKNNREDTQIYPLFRTHIPYKELIEWEVVEIFEQ